MNPSEITRVFAQFEKKNVLIIGDVMIDSYLIGKVNRISPEAPVPVVSVTEREKRLGGASNVALNVKALGANPIMASVISDDEVAADFLWLLEKQGLTKKGILKSKERITSSKTRVISNYQHLLRVDEEITDPLSNVDEARFKDHINYLITHEKVDVIILQDYNKGVLTPMIIEYCIELAKIHKIPITADPKKENFFAFKGVDLFKPNLKELSEGINQEVVPKVKSLKKAVKSLREHMNCEICLITLSEKGVFVDDSKKADQFPAHLRNIADVSGAGDTVIAVASLGLTTSMSVQKLAKLSNLAGGLVCEKVGVVPIDKEQLMEEAITIAQ